MKKSYGILSFCAALFLSTGCVGLTDEGAKVKVVTDVSMVQKCELKGRIRSYSPWANSTAHKGLKNPETGVKDSDFNNTLQQTRNAAAEELGADTVLVGGSYAPVDEGFLTDMLSTEFRSTAYRCN
ncbi:MAG: hypothetical protein HQM13_21545 [SAR324 cluster bacterium]|nr:hypothetical protein [SAR324 cluster bacterium]